MVLVAAMTAKKAEVLRVLSGSWRPDRAKHEELMVVPIEPLIEIPEPPDYLPNGHAAAEWRRLARVLVSARLLSAGNLPALAIMCGLYGQIVALWQAGASPPAALVGQYRALLADLGLTGMQLPREPSRANRFANNGRRP